MKIGYIDAENFLSIGKSHISLDFNQGLVLVEGNNKDNDTFESNGAGKSSVSSEALLWCLYGQTVRGLKHDDVINTKVGKDCRVSVSFELNGKNYSVNRYRKHKQYKDALHVWENGVDIAAGTNKDTEDKLKAVLPVDFDTFLYTTVIGQGTLGRFSTLTDAGRKELLETVVRVDLYEKCCDVSRKKLTVVKTELSGLNARATELKARQASVRGTIASLEAEAKAKRDRLDVEHKQIMLDMWDSAENVREQRKVAEESDAILKSVHAQFEEQKTKYTAAEAAYTAAYKVHHDAQYTLERITLEIKRVANLPPACKTCGQQVAIEFKVDILKALDADEALARAKVAEAAEGHTEAFEVKKSTKEAYDNLTGTCNQILQAIDRANNTIKVAQAKADMLQKRLDAISVESAQVGNTTDVLQQELTDVSMALAGAESRITVCQASESAFNFWVESFPRIRAMLLTDVISFLNGRIEHYLGIISDATLKMVLALDEKGRVIVTTSTPGGSYTSASGGERRRMDVAVALGLSDLAGATSGFSSNLLVADEPGDALDGVGMARLTDILREKAGKVGTVLLISHNQAMKGFVDKVWTVIKENGISRLEGNSSEAPKEMVA